MADFLHADAIKQLEVALFGSPASEVTDLLSGGVAQTRPVTAAASAQPCPHTYTSTPPAPPPASVPVVGVTASIHIPVVPQLSQCLMMMKTTLLKTKISTDSAPISKCHQITTTLSSPSVPATSSASSISFPVLVVPKLAISAEAYPEHLSRPGGGKDYLCCLCHFRHSKLVSILTHVRKHLDVTIGCSICGRG